MNINDRKEEVSTVISKIVNNKYPYIIIITVLLNTVAFGQTKDVVNGNLIQFSDNGAWCWYQDERAVVDVAGGKLIVGCVGNGAGVGGSPRQGDIYAIIFDPQTGLSRRFTLKNALTSYGGGDDHNAPAFLVRPDGKYLAFYAGHNNDEISYYRIYDANGWGPEAQFDWNVMPGGSNFATTYSNLFYLEAEGLTYNIARNDERSPNIMVSDDFGDNWVYGGMLTQPDVGIGYVNGYFKYWGNGIDRIDFICTEHHPRDFHTSIHHGYVRNGQSFKSDGTLLDSDIFDKTAPYPAQYTLVFASNTVVQDVTMTRCWNHDVQRYDDGTIAALIKARANNSEYDHRFFYCRYDGSNWTSTYLGKAGSKLYGSEEDYTGLGALHPNDPNTIYISTTYDPRNNVEQKSHEIFKGVTDDQGATWTWTPITQNSTRDNLRPIVPAWDENNTALLWWRGTYFTSQIFDATVVGIIESSAETVGLKSYIDANSANTLLSDSTALITTGPDADEGAVDNLWHERTGYGNLDTVLTSAEIDGEDAPMLKTQVAVPETGTYDVWVSFWANPRYDWRIKAGLSNSEMQIFRHMACKKVDDGDHDIPLILSAGRRGSMLYLYQAYLGRVQIKDDLTLDVFVDDEAIELGTEDTLTGNTVRTWYDGISYAPVSIESPVDIIEDENTVE